MTDKVNRLPLEEVGEVIIAWPLRKVGHYLEVLSISHLPVPTQLKKQGYAYKELSK